MTEASKSIEVRWQHRVLFTRDVFCETNPTLAHLLGKETEPYPPRVLVTADSGLLESFPELRAKIDASMATLATHPSPLPVLLEIPGGEPCKNDPAILWKLLEEIHRRGLCRHSYLVAVGGGAHLDVAGLAAALAHRGIRLIRIPTTGLAQADSGVGVKNGINAFGKKNFLGTFAPPHAVILDSLFLERMPFRELQGGFAEAIKVALIRDGSFFDWIEAHADELLRRDPATVEALVRRAATLHLDHITGSGDPFEQGSSRPLDFGHWAAHKLEALSDFTMRHGEAVAIGMALDSIYSARCGNLDRASLRRILDLIRRLGFALDSDLLKREADGRHPTLLAGLEEFREHLGGKLTITMLAGIGKAFDIHLVSQETVLASLAELNQEAL
jgi:3-dehydroquinate synthase